MKITISKQVLYQTLTAIGKVINPKSLQPILSDFFFSVKDGRLAVVASDNDITLEAVLELSEFEGEGEIALPAKSLLDALRDIPDQPINVYIDTDTLAVTIAYLNGEFNLIGQSADEYPESDKSQFSADTINIPSAVLYDGLSRTIFAVANDELRPVMNGVFVSADSEGITFVASDGHLLSYSRSTGVRTDNKVSMVLPKKSVALIRTLIDKDSDTVLVGSDGNRAYFTMPGFTMKCRLVDGRYPNYKSVIPQDNPFEIIVDRMTMIGVLKRVSVSCPAESGLVKLSISSDKINISAQNHDFGVSAKEDMSCIYNGSPMDIGFKATFLIETLGNMTCDSVKIKLSEPSKAGVIVPEHEDDNESIIMLIMPMVLND